MDLDDPVDDAPQGRTRFEIAGAILASMFEALIFVRQGVEYGAGAFSYTTQRVAPLEHMYDATLA